MDRKLLLNDMRACVGTQDPIVFFEKMVDVFDALFDKIESLETKIDGLEEELGGIKTSTALAIHWEPKVARTMITDQIEFLRQDKTTYFEEVSALKKAFVEDKVTQNYTDFCAFWEETLGYHPFLDYK